MRSHKIRYSKFAVGVSLLLAGSPASAIFCVVDPIVPPCCPTPCPVFDAVRVPKLLDDGTSLKQAIDADTKIVQSMTQLEQTIGDTKATVPPVAKQLSAFPSTISSEVTAIQLGLPTNPVAAFTTLKQAMFDVGEGGQSSVTQSATRKSSRIAAAEDEQAGALALSLSKSHSLPSTSSLQNQIATTAAGSDQLHADFAANSTSRLALYQDVGALHQLAAAWLSHRASLSALKHPNTAGGAVPQSAPTGTDTNSAGNSPDQMLQSSVDQLISLHDNRVSAQTLLDTYPALQQIIASAGLADQFATAAEKALVRSLSDLGIEAGSSLFKVEQALTSVDTTGWLDNGKDTQAQEAVAQVLALLPGEKGSLPPSLLSENSSADQQLKQAMASWLDASKQRQYWALLAQSAQNSIANLDRSLGALSDQAGIDLTSPSAAATEKALLTQLKHNPAVAQWQGVITAADQDPGARSVLLRTVTQ